jgi:SAM-dependent methyltransferase
VTPHEHGLAAVGADLDHLPAAMRGLDELALATTAEVLRRAGLFRPGVRHTAEQVLDRLRVASRHRWIVHGWLRALVEEHLLRRDPATGLLHDLSPTTPAARVRADVPRLCARLGYPPAVSAFFLAAAERLPSLLRDEVSAQSLLFDAGDTATADGVYRGNVVNTYLNAVAAAVAAERLPTSRRARVLEVGAGVGGTALPLLAALRDRDLEYVFTDVSRFFLDGARDALGEDRRVRFALLDVNDAAAATPAPDADLVVAANVLHNAVDVRDVLRRVRSWLRPGGALVLVESGRELRQASVSMQFLMSPAPGARPAGDGDLRAGQNRVFLTRDEWTAELHEAGLHVRTSLPPTGHPLDALGQFAVIAERTTSHPNRS